MHETQDTIRQWQLSTFGQTSNLMRTATRANEEMAELLTKIALADTAGIAAELADIFIVLCGIASPLGIDIMTAVDEKMQINRNRKWRITDEGHGYHIKD